MFTGRQVEQYPNPERNTLQPVLVAAGGITDPVRRAADIVVVTLEDFLKSGQGRLPRPPSVFPGRRRRASG